MKLNAIFSDNMILQANKPIYVFGSGRGKAIVEISDKESHTFNMWFGFL